MTKNGFTLIEVLVVVVLIATLSMVAFPSYKKSREVAANEAARVKLLEVANAARMFNEDITEDYVAGGFGNPISPSFRDPNSLFFGTSNAQNEKFAYLKNRSSWECVPPACGASGLEITYKGYSYYVCNPEGANSDQPDEVADICVADNDVKIAVMEKKGAKGRYAGYAWVSGKNLGVVGNNYNMDLDVEI